MKLMEIEVLRIATVKQVLTHSSTKLILFIYGKPDTICDNETQFTAVSVNDRRMENRSNIHRS